MRRAPLDFKLRVEAGELLIGMGESTRGIRVLRSCADYFTLAGFPVRALWALKLELDDLPASLEGVMAEVDRRATDIIRGVNFPDRLPAFPLLSELAEGPFLTVARAMRLRRADEGQALVREGEPGQSVHVVVMGRAHVVKHHGDGRISRLATLDEGDIFGEMSMITESPRVATVVADGGVDVFELSRAVLDDLGADASTLQSVLSRHVSDRMVNNLINLSPVFKGLPRNQRRRLMKRFESRLFERDQAIITEGEPSGGLYIILDGMVKVVRQHDGEMRTLNLLREGDIMGEISLIHNSAATATCRATRRTMVLYLSRKGFDQAARDFPGMKERISQLGEIRLLENIYTLA